VAQAVGQISLVPELIEPNRINITGALPKAANIQRAFYLGYGRNAWHSVWTNKYMPGSINFSAEKLKAGAEHQRVQGSVFKIEAIPMLVLQYPTNSFGIVPINDRSKFEYDLIRKRMGKDSSQNFWNYLPHSRQNWLLILALEELPKREKFVSSKILSRSIGGNYRLVWEPAKGADFHQFLTFAKSLSRRLTKKKVKKLD
jgi:hypothetical protein